MDKLKNVPFSDVENILSISQIDKISKKIHSPQKSFFEFVVY